MERRTILIAADASVRTLDAVRLGEVLARLSGAPVALATAFPRMPLESDAERALLTDAEATLRELGATMEGVELADVRVVEAFSAARAFQQLSEEEHAGLIVVGSTHRGALGRVLLGSVAERLLHGAACPVAVAPAGYADVERSEIGLVGVGYDGSDEAELALEGAAALARRAGAQLRIVAVHQRVSFAAVPASAGMPVSTEAIDERREKELRAALDRAVAAARGQGLEAEGVLATGEPAEALAEHSRALDLLVTGSRGYGPIGAVLLGGTTHRLLSSAACPLIVTPRGRRLEIAA
jgi:nucleotide-binding universal stress UspA family protein